MFFFILQEHISPILATMAEMQYAFTVKELLTEAGIPLHQKDKDLHKGVLPLVVFVKPNMDQFIFEKLTL
jgi:hypothetical protein